MKKYRAPTRALDIKIVNFSAVAVALVARNFPGALLLEKGTVK